jgi:uncharacterized protein
MEEVSRESDSVTSAPEANLAEVDLAEKSAVATQLDTTENVSPTIASTSSDPTSSDPDSDSNELEQSSPFSVAFEQLDPRSMQLERVTWSIIAGVLAIVGLLSWLVCGFLIRGTFDELQWVLLAVLMSVVALTGFGSWFFPGRSYRAASWRLSQHGVEIRNGIWWRHRIFIPKERIQHTDINQGPIMRMYGLANLIINTGGTHEPSIPLSGLSLETAERVRAQLSYKSGET